MYIKSFVSVITEIKIKDDTVLNKHKRNTIPDQKVAALPTFANIWLHND
jgi:hypothetical protein